MSNRKKLQLPPVQQKIELNPDEGDAPLMFLPVATVKYVRELKEKDWYSRSAGINGYLCETCGLVTVTVDKHPGVTPFVLSCRMEGCRGITQSMMYPPAMTFDVPLWEWYRPSADENKTLDSYTKDHVRNGGLLLRKIGDK